MTPTRYITLEDFSKLNNPTQNPQSDLITDEKLILAKIKKEGSKAFDLASEALKEKKIVRDAFRKKRFKELISLYKDNKSNLVSNLRKIRRGLFTSKPKKDPVVIAFLKFTSKKLRSNYNFMLEAVQLEPWTLQLASKDLKSNKTFIFSAMEKNSLLLQFASEELRNNYDFMLEAVQKNPWTLEFASTDLKDNETIVRAAMQFASDELRDNYDFMLETIKMDPWLLQYASKDLKNNKVIVSAAMKKVPYVLQHASNELKDNHDFILEAVQLDPWLLQYASKDLKNNKAMALAIVKKSGIALIHKKFKNDPDIRDSTCTVIFGLSDYSG